MGLSYLRIVALTHNPVFPFLARFFPGSGSPWEAVAGAGAGQAWRSSPRGMVVGLWQPRTVLSLPWRAVFDREAFHHESPLSGAYLVLIPLMALLAVRDRRLRRWLLLAFAHAMMWTAYDTRFQLPAVALLSVGGGMALAQLLELPALGRLRRRGTVAMLAFLLAAPGPLYACYRCWRLGPVPEDAAARERFLVQQFPSYEAVRWLRAHTRGPYTVYAFGMESLVHYVDGRCLCAVGGPYAQWRAQALLATPERLHAQLSCWGAQYLLFAHRDPVLEPTAPLPPVPDSPAFRAAFTLQLRTPSFELYALNPPPSAAAPAIPPMQCLR